jgi:hypothetical protein
MKCPGDPEHEGIEVTFLNSKSPHHASARCAICGVWIKWLSKREAKQLNGKETMREAEILGVDLSIEFTNEIRKIVREEIQKHLGGESQ